MAHVNIRGRAASRGLNFGTRDLVRTEFSTGEVEVLTLVNRLKSEKPPMSGLLYLAHL
jgi:hypothetical protein